MKERFYHNVDYKRVYQTMRDATQQMLETLESIQQQFQAIIPSQVKIYENQINEFHRNLFYINMTTRTLLDYLNNIQY